MPIGKNQLAYYEAMPNPAAEWTERPAGISAIRDNQNGPPFILTFEGWRAIALGQYFGEPAPLHDYDPQLRMLIVHSVEDEDTMGIVIHNPKPRRPWFRRTIAGYVSRHDLYLPSVKERIESYRHLKDGTVLIVLPPLPTGPTSDDVDALWLSFAQAGFRSERAWVYRGVQTDGGFSFGVMSHGAFGEINSMDAFNVLLDNAPMTGTPPKISPT